MDDIALGMQRGGLLAKDLPLVDAQDLGPLIELRHAGLAGEGVWLSCGRYAALVKAMDDCSVWYHPSSAQGFVTAAAIQADYAHWTDFAMRAKRAAVGAGFPGNSAAQLVAAMGELHANIVEHSERTESGYLVYDARDGLFEFVVADAGIGVLQSLRSHPHFATIVDAGTALELALSEGVSRFYKQVDRGRGFRPIFVGLANASRHLRFRSADHSREVARTENGALSATTRQGAQLHGFVCSVICEARS